MGLKKNGLDRELELSNCDIEIQKYHMSMAMSLMMPFVLAFASVGVAADDNTLKTFFFFLSIGMLFVLAAIIFFDSSKLKKKYNQKKGLINNKYK